LVPISALVVVRAVPRLLGVGVQREFVRQLVVGDSLSLVFFSVFVGLAVYFRRRGEIHKRLMMAACLMIYGPVLERLWANYGLPRLTDVFWFLGLAAIGIYDFMTTRRIERVTVLLFFGTPMIFYPLVSVLLRSGVIDSLIDAVR
jgi:hypothetical protein